MPFLYYLFLIVLLFNSPVVQANNQLKLQQPLQILVKESFASLTQDTQTPEVLYGTTPIENISTADYYPLYNGGYLYKSTDKGIHWTLMEFGGRFLKVVIDPVNDQHLYAFQIHAGYANLIQFAYSKLHLFKSIDGGKTWVLLSDVQNNIGLSSYGKTPELFISPTEPNRLYIFNDGKLHNSDDGGTNWREIKLYPLIGGVNDPATYHPVSFVVHPNNFNILYIAYRTHLFQSKDAGTTWQSISYSNIATEKLDGDSTEVTTWTIADFYQLWNTPTQPDVLYLDVAMRYITKTNKYQRGETITYKSSDEGKTWQAISRPQIQIAECTTNCYRGLFYIDPYHKGVLYSYASLYTNKLSISYEDTVDVDGYIFAIYRSQDDGNTWNQVMPFTRGFLSSILSDPQQLDTFYVSSVGTANVKYDSLLKFEGQLQLTENAGKTWQALESHVKRLVTLNSPVLHPTNPKIFYATGSDAAIYQTVDGGHQFTALPRITDSASNSAEVKSDMMIAVTENAVLGSTYHWMNQQWQAYRTNADPAFHPVVVIGSDIYTAEVDKNTVNDSRASAVYSRSRDNGNTWQTLNSGKPLPIDVDGTGINIVVHPTEKNKLYFHLLSYDNRNSNNFSYQHYIYQSVDDGETWQDITGGLPKTYNSIHPYQLLPHPTQSQTLYFSYDGYIHKTADNGKSWKIVGDGIIPREKFKLWFDPNNSQTMYAMLTRTNDPRFLYKSTDAGETWRNVSLALQEDNAYTVTYEALRFAPNSGKIIYVAKAKERMYQSEDGEHWEVITDAARLERESPTGMLLSFSLPDMAFQGTYRVEYTGNAVSSILRTDAATDATYKTYVQATSSDNIKVQVAEYADQAAVNLKQTDPVTVQAKFEINNIEAYEQPAVFFVVSHYQPANNSDSYWLMQTADKQWQPWDGKLENLQPAKIVNQLQATESLDIFTGAPQGLTGTSSIYTAYRSVNGVTTISNQNTPLVLKIE